jgi:hypothetical protein
MNVLIYIYVSIIILIKDSIIKYLIIKDVKETWKVIASNKISICFYLFMI